MALNLMDLKWGLILLVIAVLVAAVCAREMLKVQRWVLFDSPDAREKEQGAEKKDRDLGL